MFSVRYYFWHCLNLTNSAHVEPSLIAATVRSIDEFAAMDRDGLLATIPQLQSSVAGSTLSD